MDYRLGQIHRAVNLYDRELFARRENTGAIHIYRRGVTFQHYEIDGAHLSYSVPSPQYICALTTNGTVSGKPADWGIEFLLSHLRKHDLDKNPNMMDSLMKSYELKEESRLRSQNSEFEAFAKDTRRQFAKATDDLLVSSMVDKDKERQRRNKWQS